MLGRIRTGYTLALAPALFCCFATPICAQSSSVIRLPWTEWKTHLTDDPRCAAVSDPACVWQGPGVPVDRYKVDIWQRIDVDLPAQLRTPQQLGLLIQSIYPVYEVFVNGNFIGGSGSFKTRRGPNDPRSVLAFSSTLAQGGHLAISIHTLHLYAGYPIGGLAPALGPLEQIRNLENLDIFSSLSDTSHLYLSVLIVLLASPIFLVFYFMDRKAHEYLWLATMLGAFALTRLSMFSGLVDIGLGSWMANLLFAICIPLYRFAFIEFPFALMGRRVTLPFRILEALLVAMLIQLLVLLPLPMHMLRTVTAASNFVRTLNNYGTITSNVAWLMVLPACFRSRRPEMKLIGASVAFMVFTDIASHALFVLPGPIAWSGLTSYIVAEIFRSYAFLAFTVAMLFAMAARFRRMELRNQAVEQELAAAAAVQSLLLSSASAVHSAFAVETAYLPAGEVGGDFFYIVPDESSDANPGARDEKEGGLLVVVGDVSGKGLKAAMTVSAIIGALRGCTDHRPATVLKYLNRVLFGQISGFVTCCAAHLSPDGTVAIANAGHPAPYLNGVEIETVPGLPLGVEAQTAWPEQTLKLARDERLTFVSDGVVEAGKADGELFGFERTQAISTQSAESIAATAKSFCAGVAQADDITVLGITRPLPAV
ncbi:MAG TPA: PP2C family protein-serine/threonine phosphatase [Terracidiphilus sp.]|nr:PP2C family protein-serine/threonine phosphatase [Terracidiphilus sp.]